MNIDEKINILPIHIKSCFGIVERALRKYAEDNDRDKIEKILGNIMILFLLCEELEIPNLIDLLVEKLREIRKELQK